MSTVRITDPDTFNHAVEILVNLGGAFETWGVGVLVMTPDQKAILEKAGIVSEPEDKSQTNGKKKAASRPKRSGKRAT